MITRATLRRWLPTKELLALARETTVLDQIERGLDEGDYYDAAAAEQAMAFFRDYLVHIEGDFAGKPFIPDPWEELTIRTVFGWMCADGTRKIQRVFIEIPRKNGKSSFGAGIVCKCVFADGEVGAQVYGTAFTKPQAAIIFRVVELMILRSEGLRERAEINHGSKQITVVDPQTKEPTGSFYRALAGEVKGQTGYNTHAYVCDELHEQEDDELLGVMRSSTTSRRNPLAVFFTTAGEKMKSPAGIEHDRALAVLKGTVIDRRGLVIVFALPAGADWKSEKNWYLVNPGLRTGMKRIGNMRSEFDEAQGHPSKENSFKRFHLDIWGGAAKGWLSLESWDRGGEQLFDETELAARICIVSVDLASTDDVAAVGYTFPGADEAAPWVQRWDFFIPADNIAERVKRSHVAFDEWVAMGWIHATPGPVINYDAIRTRLLSRIRGWKAPVKELAYDPWQAEHFAQDLEEEGFHRCAKSPCDLDAGHLVEIHNTTRYMNLGVKTAEELILSGRLLHGGNPVARWMFGNVVMMTNSAGERKPDKAKSVEKIDGITTLVMGCGRAAVYQVQAPSVYKTRGLVVLGA